MKSFAKSFGSNPTVLTSTVEIRKADVFYIVTTERPESLPLGAMTIEQVIARSESTPFRAERLRQARKRLAQRLYGEDLTLKSLRMRAGLSQAKVAEMIGTSQSHIARVESGSDALMIDTCRKLCHALNVDMNTLDKALTNSQHLFTTRKK